MESKAPHKVWTGTLAFGLITMPVQLYTAARKDRLSFNQLHDCANEPLPEGAEAPEVPLQPTRVKQGSLQCPQCSLDVEKDKLLKGYEYEKGKFVTFTPDEVKASEPESAKTLDLLEFVPFADVDPIYFESSFFLSPGDGANKVFTLIRQSMIDREVAAVSRFYYSDHEHAAVIRPVDGGLMLHTIFWAHEVRQMVFPTLTQVNPAELAIAGQLIDSLVSVWEPNKYQDEHRKHLLSLVEDKKQGKTITAPVEAPRKPAQVIDIAAALQASIARAEKAKAAKGAA